MSSLSLKKILWTSTSPIWCMVLLILDTVAFQSFQSMPLHVISRADRLHYRSPCFEHIICTSISMYLRHPLIPSTKLHMVRNIDLPEAIVFYGVESMMETHSDDGSSFVLRPGIIRLLNECRDVGTSSLLLSEVEDDTEESLHVLFQTACEQSASDNRGDSLRVLTNSDAPVLSFRCLSSEFVIPTSPEDQPSDTSEIDPIDDESLELYNLQASGRSPSPAFLLDALRSIHIDPRGFGGSSGFARGQWIDPRRSPMTARTVVFIAGDRVSTSNQDSTLPRVKCRCDAARASGCRVIYLENLEGGGIQDDTQTLSLCDAVIDTYGNDNPRDLQPISLDAISTPGDYWLNPPNQRDEFGNAVSIDELVEWYRSERESDKAPSDTDHIKADEIAQEEISEDELAKILADLDII